jgi:hypothetical protein
VEGRGREGEGKGRELTSWGLVAAASTGRTPERAPTVVDPVLRREAAEAKPVAWIGGEDEPSMQGSLPVGRRGCEERLQIGAGRGVGSRDPELGREGLASDRSAGRAVGMGEACPSPSEIEEGRGYGGAEAGHAGGQDRTSRAVNAWLVSWPASGFVEEAELGLEAQG